MNVVTNAFGECDAFALATEAREIVGRVEMIYAFDFLLDDRSRVEVVGDIVTSGADQFYATFIGLAVRVSTNEGGQE